MSRVYTSKMLVAYYTMDIITFVTLLYCKFILKKFGQIFFEILAHFSMAVTLSRPGTARKI